MSGRASLLRSTRATAPCLEWYSLSAVGSGYGADVNATSACANPGAASARTAVTHPRTAPRPTMAFTHSRRPAADHHPLPVKRRRDSGRRELERIRVVRHKAGVDQA